MDQVYRMFIILIGGMMILNCASSRKVVQPKELYKDDEARKIAHASYDAVMENWPVDFTEEWITTDFGRSHVIVSGPEDGKPIFLFAGLFADATMWYANVGPLASNYRVICPDQMTYGGKSEPAGKAILNINDYSQWFEQLLDHYGYDKVGVVGLSYGSWLGLALSRQMPENICAVVMLDPSETFTKMDGGIAWRGFRDFMWFPNRDKYRRFFEWMGGEFSTPESDLWFEHILDVIEFGSIGMFDIPQHRIYTNEELGMVTMPVLIMVGGIPIVYKDPQKFAEAAAKALPHAEIEIVPGTGHSLNLEKADEVNSRMVSFFEENYR